MEIQNNSKKTLKEELLYHLQTHEVLIVNQSNLNFENIIDYVSKANSVTALLRLSGENAYYTQFILNNCYQFDLSLSENKKVLTVTITDH